MVEATAEEKEAGAVEFDYTGYDTGFESVLECVHDILDLYTDHMNATFCGPKFGADAFIAVRIELNREGAKYGIPPNNNNVYPLVNGQGQQGLRRKRRADVQRSDGTPRGCEPLCPLGARYTGYRPVRPEQGTGRYRTDGAPDGRGGGGGRVL